MLQLELAQSNKFNSQIHIEFTWETQSQEFYDSEDDLDERVSPSLHRLCLSFCLQRNNCLAKYTNKEPLIGYTLLKAQRQTFHRPTLSGEPATQKSVSVLQWKRWILLYPLEYGWLRQQHHRQQALPNLREPRLPVQKPPCQQRPRWSLSTTTAAGEMYAER